MPVRYRTETIWLPQRYELEFGEASMDNEDISERLGALTAELDQVRRSLMADEPRHQTYAQIVKAKADADALLADLEIEANVYRLAAE